MPKFGLISIPGYSQGIRYEDIFLICVVLYVVIKNKIRLSYFPCNKLYFFFYGIIILYSLYSAYSYGIVSIVLVLRWLEYSMFFVLLFYSSLTPKFIRNFIIVFIVINSVIGIFQYFGMFGGIYSHGYIKNIEGRVSGLTGGSWELPAMLSLMIVPLIVDKTLNYKIKLIVSLMATFLVFASGTRTGIITYSVVFIVTFLHTYRINLTRTVLLIIVGLMYFYNTRAKYYVNFNGINLPGSLAIRLEAWLLRYNEMKDYDLFLGKGLGFTGLYVDGMYAKIFLDMGVLGLLLFLIYYYNFLKSYKAIALVVILYCLTLDLFSASKIMFTLYLTVYYLGMMRHKPFLGHPDKR